jgi:hypothetical protein
LLKFIKIPGISGFSRISRDLKRLEVDTWDSLGCPTNPPQSKQENSCKNPNLIEKFNKNTNQKYLLASFPNLVFRFSWIFGIPRIYRLLE